MSNYSAVDPEEAMFEAGTLPKIKTPPLLGEAAYYGLAGEFVRALQPCTEADPAAILGQVLVAFGVACGRGPNLIIDGSRHGVNEDLVLVGESSRARKGTSWKRTRETLAHADSEFFKEHVKTGLSSGEGLIYQVRDPVETFDPKKKEYSVTDPGIADKRILIVEEEFASVLKMLERDGNTLSPILRVAWDGGKLSPLTKGNRIEATNAHIGFIGQITKDELKRRLTETETSNGFGNRILWFYTRRSKLLPFGMKFERDVEFGKRFRSALEYSKTVGQMGLDEGFRALWESVYPVLTEAVPGLAGSLTSRAEAHAIRLSMIYALLDGTEILTEKHLTASLSVIDFVSDSTTFLFGEATGNPIADKIMSALDSGPISLTAISLLFDGHETKKNIERALTELSESGKIAVETESGTGGRPKTIIRKKGG